MRLVLWGLVGACGVSPDEGDRPDRVDTVDPIDEPGVVPKPGEPSRCTQVLGYSQVGQRNGGWYTTGGAFEAMVDDDAWQLSWASGAGVDRWQDASDRAWEAEVESPCSDGPEAPDRVLLSVSGPYGDDVSAWAAAIEASVAQIRNQLPSADTIVLQAVVGGPDHATCPWNANDDVRASWQHAHIDEAIAQVTGGDVVEGFSPEVRDCDDYRDSTGHLTREAAEAIGTTIGAFYAGAE